MASLSLTTQEHKNTTTVTITNTATNTISYNDSLTNTTTHNHLNKTYNCYHELISDPVTLWAA